MVPASGRHRRQPRIDARLVAVALTTLLFSCGGDDHGTPPPPVTASTYPAPWQRTETREPCDDFAPLRQPYFGDLHVHTRLSADATIYGTKVGPRDAYDFARGATIPLCDDDEQQTRSAQ